LKKKIIFTKKSWDKNTFNSIILLVSWLWSQSDYLYASNFWPTNWTYY